MRYSAPLLKYLGRLQHYNNRYQQTVIKIHSQVNTFITLMKQNSSGGCLRIDSERCQTVDHVARFKTNENKQWLT